MIRLERLEPERVLGRDVAQVAEVWTGVDRKRLDEILPRHVTYDGFRFLAARTDDGTLAGFAYGYFGRPGQWWHDRVSRAMTSEQRARWLAPGHFELVELHVRKELRRGGVGGRLHDEILDGLPSATAVLSTQTDNTPALRLYHGRGWRVVVPELRFTERGTKFSILARDLADGAHGVGARE